jgi:gliding motility-associated-like protein
MARTLTKTLVVLGLLLNVVSAAYAQQLTFAMSPNLVTPNVGDTVNLGIVVTNFTSMNSFQFTIEWDPTLFAAVRPATGMTTPTAVDSVTMPDGGNLGSNLIGNNAITIGWNASGSAKTIAGTQRIFRLRLRALAASTNFWANFTSRFTPIEAERSTGLVTPSFVPLGTPPGSGGTTPVTIAIANASTTVNQRVCVAVTTNDFTNITASNWTNTWNPAILRYDSVTSLNATLGLTASNFTPNVAAGSLAFSRTYASAQTLPAATKLYDVCFSALATGSATVATTTPTVSRTVSGVTSSATTSLSSGTVTVNPAQSSNTLRFVVENTTIPSAGVARVKVRVANFTDIATAQFNVRWDSTRMLFDYVRSEVLGLDTIMGRGGGSANFFNGFQRPTGNFWRGSLNFIWADLQGINRSLPDSTVLFEMFFTYTGASGTCSPVNITGLPVTIAAGREDGSRVTPSITNGSVCRAGGSTAIVVGRAQTDVTCPRGSNGTITLTPSGGTGTYTYNWGGSVTTQNRTGLTAGTYTVTVTSGSDTKIETFTITQPDTFAFTRQIVDVNCNGQLTGGITLTVTGGTGGYTYTWSNGATTKDLTNVVAGTYTVTVTDSRSCTGTLSNLTIAQPAAPLSIPAPTPVNVTCNGGNNGSITVAPTGGTAPYIYTWTGPNNFSATTATISSLRAGTYRLTVTDARQCAQTFVGTITEPAVISIGTSTITGTRCASSTGSITLSNITGGNGAPYTFAWTGPNSFTSTNQNLTNRVAGNYNLTITDSRSCTFTPTAFVIADTPSNITISNPTVVNLVCNGGNTGSISLTIGGATGNVTYAWSGPNRFTANTLNISSLRGGDYTLSVTDASNCPATRSVTVAQPAALTTTTLSKIDAKCKGSADGSITLEVSGGTPQYTYAWTGPNTYTSTSQSPTGLSAGRYAVTIKDNNNCEIQRDITVGDPDSLRIAAAITSVSCNGRTDGAINITVTGGTAPYRYSWTGPLGTSTQEDITALRPGTNYRVVVTDANNCTTNATYEVTEPRVLDFTASTTNATGAPNGSITLSVNGGNMPYTYNWSGAGVAPTSKDQTSLCPGTYNVTITDNRGCTIAREITVGGACSALLTLTGGSSINSGCVGQNDGSVTISWIGGTASYTVTWYRTNSNSPVLTQNINGNTTTIPRLPAGTYYAIIADNSIPTRQTIETPRYNVVGNAATMNLNAIIGAETCTGNDGSISIVVTNGAAPYKYNWGHSTLNQPDFTNLRAGVYRVTVEDNNRCLKDTNMLIVPRTPCQLSGNTQKTDVRCFGGSDGTITVNITNGEPAYTIRWGTGANQFVSNISQAGSRAATYTITGLASGTYTITITDTVSGRQTLLTQAVIQPQAITISKQINGASNGCNGSIVLTATGGTGTLTYKWNTGATSRDLFGLCCGSSIYSVTVTDANLCTTSTGNDSIPCAAMSVNTLVRQPICKNDSTNWSIEATVTNGLPPFQYEWRNERGQVVSNTNALNNSANLPPGRYTLQVRDNQNPPQVFNNNFFISVRSTLEVRNISTTDATDENSADGKLEFDVIPGSGPYRITIESLSGGGNTSSTLPQGNPSARFTASLKAGQYRIYVTDNQSCTETFIITVKSKKCATLQITPFDTVYQIRCNSECTGRATVISTAPDLVAPLNYRWSSGETGPIALNLCAGSQSLIITDGTSRRCTVAVNLREPPKLEATIKIDRVTRCIEAIPTGGVTPYKYRWTNTKDDTLKKICDIKSGEFSLLVLDRNGCPFTDKVVVRFGEDCLSGAVVITPNDDGRNDFFKINTSGCDYKSIRLEVYNRWGALVFSKDNYNDTWFGNDQDGQSGTQLPDGVYMYIVRGTNLTGQIEAIKGTVTIVRQ